MLTGSCLCGGVRYEIDGELRNVTNCHCSLCRKMTGATFSTGATISANSFRFVAGEELIKGGNPRPDITGSSAGDADRRSSSEKPRIRKIFVFALELWTQIPGSNHPKIITSARKRRGLISRIACLSPASKGRRGICLLPLPAVVKQQSGEEPATRVCYF